MLFKAKINYNKSTNKFQNSTVFAFFLRRFRLWIFNKNYFEYFNYNSFQNYLDFFVQIRLDRQ